MEMQKYKVTGMHCAACQARVEKAVSAVAGVETANVSLLTNSMGVSGRHVPEEVIAAVEKAGGYKETYHLFEDYYLWVRMLMKGFKARNVENVLLDMRSPADMYQRRGGKKYAKDMLRFHRWMKKSGWSSEAEYLTGAVPHAVVCVLPNGVRKLVYRELHERSIE